MGWPNRTKENAPKATIPTSTCEESEEDNDNDVKDVKWDLLCESDSGDKNAVTVSVHPTTGGQFTIQVTITDPVDTLKKVVSHKLKVPKERICLLYRDRLLREGTLNDNLVVEGAKIILLPSVEAGLLTLRPEQSVMQALESLNDSQVNDFLSGKAPLNLTMRLGDYMMIIQLQLSSGSKSSSQSVGGASNQTGDDAGASSGDSANNDEDKQNSPSCSRACSSHHSSKEHEVHAPSSSSSSVGTSSSDANEASSSSGPEKPYRISLDTVALAEASRNLTQALRQFSLEVLKTATSQRSHGGPVRKQHASTCCASNEAAQQPKPERPSSSEVSQEPVQSTSNGHGESQQGTADSTAGGSNKTPEDESCKPSSSTSSSSDSSSKQQSGRHQAVIEKMRHHGCGVYSGTFCGTLNPQLQDTQGKPWPGIATIIHILNDLLGANPRHGSFCNHKRKSSQDPGSCDQSPPKQEKKQPEKEEEPECSASADSADQLALENETTRIKVEALREYLKARKQQREVRQKRKMCHADEGCSQATPELSSLSWQRNQNPDSLLEAKP